MNIGRMVKATGAWVMPYGLVASAKLARELASGDDLSAALRLCARPSHRNTIRNANLALLPLRVLRSMGSVVDIGANAGNWTAAIRLVAPEASILAVEPNPTLAEGLRRRFGNDPAIKVRQVAIGQAAGKIDFHLTLHDTGSSVLRPGGSHRHLLGTGVDVVETIAVDLTALDELLRDVDEVSLLKLDIQGYERAAIEGAQDVLPRTRYVLVEANLVHQYEDDILLPELLDLLYDAGFELCNLSEPNRVDGQAISFDALMINRRL